MSGLTTRIQLHDVYQFRGLYQGTTSVEPHDQQKEEGPQPLQKSPGAKAQIVVDFYGTSEDVP
jgi:hypothetical protein